MPTEYRDDAGAAVGDGGAAVVNPGEIAPGAAPPAGAEPGAGKRKRGRPPGSGNAGSAASGASKGKVALDLSSITGLFVGAHILLAEKTGIPELSMGMDEGQQFMKAAQNVMRHYSVQTTQKAMDWIAFAGVSAMIYVPRVVALSNNRRAPRQVQRPPMQAPQTVQNVEAAPPPGSPLEQAYHMQPITPEYDH